MKRENTINTIIILLAMADVMITCYYWVTTYIPIYTRRAALIFAWDYWPIIRSLTQRTLILLGGLIMTGGLLAYAASIRVSVVISEGWHFRSDLINEWRTDDDR